MSANLWQTAPADPLRERRWMEELSAQGLPVDTLAGEAPRGVAASLEPTTGDPQALAVVPEGDPEAFWVDRRTMRLSRVPRTSLAEEAQVVRAADLADRAQLVLGEPVLVRYAGSAGKLVIAGIRPLRPRIQFTTADYRETAALIAHAGTLAPLAVDALSRALQLEGDRGEEPRVRRIFSRAYRRIDAHHTPWADEKREALRALGRVSRLGRDVLLGLSDARRFSESAAEAFARCDQVSLPDLDRRDLVAALDTRMSIVTQALGLLERSRLSTLSLLPALEALCGSVPRDFFDALAAPHRAPERNLIDHKLAAFAARCVDRYGALRLPPADGAAELGQQWQDLRQTLGNVRMLGMDVRPENMGESDQDLAEAVEEVWAMQQVAPEEARRRAEMSVLKLAAIGPLGALASAPAGALLLLMRRLADAKGAVAERLSEALLRLRKGALEAGQRLLAEGILERAEDTLYMPLDEIEEALEGELGAYAARVRLRREDDRRWRNFAAPRWIPGRSR